MKKLKTILLCVATLALVILCASLPRLTAIIADKKAEKAPVYKAIQPISLEVQEGSEAFSMLEKLSLYANGQSLIVKSTKATKTEDQIKACVEAFMSRCQASEIYQGFQPSSATVTTKFVYDVGDSSKSIIVWRYYATMLEPIKDSPMQETELRALDVIVDDETGKILSVSFDHYGVGYNQDGLSERNRSRVEPLIDMYFSQLGLLEKAEIAEASMGKLYEYTETDLGVTEVHYTILDPACGTIKITFAVGGVDAFQVIVAGV